MKKRLSMFLLFALLLGTSATAVDTPAIQEEMDELFIDEKSDMTTYDGLIQVAEAHSTVDGNIKTYIPFEIENQEVRLYKETTMTAADATDKYANAYSMISDLASEYGISPSLDDPEFRDFAMSFAYYETDDKLLNFEIIEFAKFVDIYENSEKNKMILQSASANRYSRNEIDLNVLMPADGHSTVQSQENEPYLESRSSSYDSDAAIRYARLWWNRTNNTDYPYYAEYYGQDSSSNEYNSLDTKRPGQSTPRRGWSDCTNFVSQCILAGGVSQIKSGVVYTQKDN